MSQKEVDMKMNDDMPKWHEFVNKELEGRVMDRRKRKRLRKNTAKQERQV